jgi:hypothetical protein
MTLYVWRRGAKSETKSVFPVLDTIGGRGIYGGKGDARETIGLNLSSHLKELGQWRSRVMRSW